MTTNTQLLDDAIKNSGVRASFIADKLGLSRTAFYKKKNGEIKWRVSEIYVVKDILRLSETDAEKIFYPESTLNSEQQEVQL